MKLISKLTFKEYFQKSILYILDENFPELSSLIVVLGIGFLTLCYAACTTLVARLEPHLSEHERCSIFCGSTARVIVPLFCVSLQCFHLVTT